MASVHPTNVLRALVGLMGVCKFFNMLPAEEWGLCPLPLNLG